MNNTTEPKDDKSHVGESYIRIKLSDLDFIINGKKFYGLYKQNKKGGKFVLACEKTIYQSDEAKVKNYLETLYTRDENVCGLRFCFANKELPKEAIGNELPDDSDLVWLELRQDEKGDKFWFKYYPGTENWESTNISFGLKDLVGKNGSYLEEKNAIWEMYPKEKYGNGEFLATFVMSTSIWIQTNKDSDNYLKEMKEIVQSDTGRSIDSNGMNIYACMQFKPEEEFYLDWKEEGNKAKTSFNNNRLGTENNHSGKFEDVFALRFYIMPEKLDINEGDKLDEAKIQNTEECSIFEIRRDKNNDMVMWHFDRNNNTWLPVNAKIICENSEEDRFSSMTNSKPDSIVRQYEYECKFVPDSDSYLIKLSSYIYYRSGHMMNLNGYTEYPLINHECKLKELEHNTPTISNEIPEDYPILLWKVFLLMGIGVALLVAMLFGLNAWLAFISVFTNPLSIIIAVIALVTFSILLVIANVTNTFKLGKLFDYERYKEYSLFHLRESNERGKQPRQYPHEIKDKS